MSDTDWRARAACRGSDLEVFYPDGREANHDQARRLCASCPVRSDCLAEAFKLHDVNGFRGGMTGDERKAVLLGERRRERGPKPYGTEIVSTLGVIRRRQALACIGYSLTDLGNRLGVSESTVASHMAHQWVLKSTHDRWRRMYDELSVTPGVNERARLEAVKRGWLPPSAWTADTIDGPTVEATRRIPASTRRRSDAAEDVRFLAGTGMTTHGIAARLGVSEPYVRGLLNSQRQGVA